MKKTFVIFSILMLKTILFPELFAYGQLFEMSQNYFSLGYGYQIYSEKSHFSDVSKHDAKGLGPICVKYERAITPKIGLGLSLSYTQARVDWVQPANSIYPISYNYLSYKRLTITPRLNYHVFTIKYFDAFVGLGIGYKNASSFAFENNTLRKYYTHNSIGSGLLYIDLDDYTLSIECSAGCRFIISNKIFGYIETGLGPCVLQAGLVFKTGGPASEQ